METMAFLGASRGLGRAVVQEFDQRKLSAQMFLASRDGEALGSLSLSHSEAHIEKLDFSQPRTLPILLQGLEDLKVQRVFYFAGGGPFGLFGEKDWKDHQWAYEVSLLTPARLLHGVIRSSLNIKQMVFVGSAIAEGSPDPKSSSYASAKHGLKGLLTSVTQEGVDFDLRLFSPGYMDTALLPKNAPPREQAQSLLDPGQVASQFVDWVQDPAGASHLEIRP